MVLVLAFTQCDLESKKMVSNLSHSVAPPSIPQLQNPISPNPSHSIILQLAFKFGIRLILTKWMMSLVGGCKPNINMEMKTKTSQQACPLESIHLHFAKACFESQRKTLATMGSSHGQNKLRQSKAKQIDSSGRGPQGPANDKDLNYQLFFYRAQEWGAYNIMAIGVEWRRL